MMLDLGELDKVFIFGGPYSNLAATQEVLRIAKDKGFTDNQIICTGDTVAYCAEPNETLQLLRESGVHIIKGNVEESLIEDRDECGCNFNVGSVCDTLSAKWYNYLKSNIDIKFVNWMNDFPDSINFNWKGLRFSIIHGSYSKINEFIYQSTDVNIKLKELRLAESDIIIGGHCGIPFAEQLSQGKYWLNAGVIGLPPNDGTQVGWFGVLDECFCANSFSYDIQKTTDAMKDKLPIEYINSLLSGIWPSQDILPADERQKKGMALKNIRFQIATF
jgi:predicted phosphodiesterase